MECSVSVLHSFEPAKDVMDWDVGSHGISISFVHNKKRYHSTYLPYVAQQQSNTVYVVWRAYSSFLPQKSLFLRARKNGIESKLSTV